MEDDHGGSVGSYWPRRVERLEAGIRKLRDDWLNGDDKCWKDLEELFKLLPEGFTPPARDESVELENCKKYIASCHHPEVKYVSPQVRIAELEEALRPLADVTYWIEPNVTDDVYLGTQLNGVDNDVTPTIGECRLAARLLEKS